MHTGRSTESGLVDRQERVLAASLDVLRPRADVILVREPLRDPDAPATSDVDLLAVGDVDGLLPERLPVDSIVPDAPPVDVIWLPRTKWENCRELAADGVIPHRILTSRLVHGRTGTARHLAALRAAMHDPSVQALRIQGFQSMGYLTVREIGVTWDFPELALFWLHMALAAVLASVADACGLLCPNVYTRPIEYARRLEPVFGLRLESTVVGLLRLDVDPLRLVAPLQRIHRVVAQRFPEPQWPAVMRSTTRFEYRYFSDPRELAWRIAVARELAARGDGAAAVFYLRCWTYFVACVALVHRRATDGLDVSFVRPAKAVKPDLDVCCPEILDDLAFVLGARATVDDVRASLDAVLDLRQQALTAIEARGVRLAELPEWQPFRPPPAFPVSCPPSSPGQQAGIVSRTDS